MTDQKIVNRMSRVGIAGNILLAAFKLFAGIFGKSSAMISDAVHSLSDVFATAIALIGVRLSQRSADSRHPYGHERFECVASLFLGVILAATGIGIGWTGIQKILSGNYSNLAIPTFLPLVAAVVSVLVKEGMFHYTMHYAKQLKSSAFEADAWHHRSDAISSIGSFLGIGAAKLGFPIMDPVASVLICLCILKVAYDILKDAIEKMLDTSCSTEFEKAITEFIESDPEVEKLDLLHTRQFSSKIYADVEISVRRDSTLLEAHAIAERLHDGIEQNFPDVKHVMIHVNPGEDKTESDESEKNRMLTLKDLKVGQSAMITSVGGEGALRQHFLDMGVIPSAEVTVVKFAPMGDPMELQIHGYELTLRLADAAQIQVERIEARSNQHCRVEKIEASEHPGLGETGKYHDASHEQPLPEGTTLTYALVGNQNCGKTTLFNQLTGANQHVGNFPGVTVDRKDGAIRGYPQTQVTDLPGIYSMSPYSSEEIVSRNFVLQEKPKAIINIVDASNIERNLYLTMQLLEMDVPMVVALNMMDEVIGNHGSIDINGMENLLGVPVVPISAAKNEGIEELVNHAIHIAQYQEKPRVQDFCSKDDHGGAIHRAHHAVEAIIEDHAERAGLPIRFAANKVIEGDPLITEQLELDINEQEMIEHVIIQMEAEGGMDRSAAIADMRFDFIERVCEKTVVKPQESRERVRSEKIDRILTGKWTAIPCFIGIMALVFWLTFNVIGAFLQDLLAMGIDALSAAVQQLMQASGVSAPIQGLVTDGIFGGVGSVLSFLPIVVTLFFFLSLMEDSGYIARVAFFMDKLLRKIGLSGRSIVPMLIGFGCTVPAVMSTRTLPSSRDRRMTILLTPFMSCSAKLPIYAFFVSAFFPGKGGFIMTGLYVLGILTGIILAVLFKNTLFKGEAVPFVMELPNYRMPGAKNVAQLLWEKAKDFLTRAFSIILIATIVVWFLQSFTPGLSLTADSSDSILAKLSGLLVPLFRPLGLGDWRIVTSLLSGFMAKESVVSTMQVLFTGGVTAALTRCSAATMLVFSLLYTPCVAAITSIRRELGGKWAAGVVIWQCAIAWIVALLMHLILMAIGI